MPKNRTRPERQIRNLLRIYCEGEKSEPAYLYGYLQYISCPAGRIKIEQCFKNTPIQLVGAACEKKKSRDSLDGDIFWVVYDREAVSAITNATHESARAKAEAFGIQIAISNICFELWLLLHLEDTCAPYNSCDELLKQSMFKEKYKEETGGYYEKSNSDTFHKLKHRLPNARLRAKRLNEDMIKAAALGMDKR